MRVGGVAIACVALASVMSVFNRTVAAQQPIFRSETRLIIEAVTVTDKEGRAVEGLTAKDFVVTEDGEPQEIAFVEFQRIAPLATASASASAPPEPAELRRDKPYAPAAPVASSITAPTPGDIRYRDKRLMVLYFDMMAMGGADQMRAFAAAQRFLGGLDNSVLVAIMAFQGGAVRVKTDFTDNRARLDEEMLI